jgi:hypothetical protein
MNAVAPYGSSLTLSQANLKITCNGAYWAATPATFGVSSGKWYWEVHITNLANNSMLGITKETDTKATTGQDVYPGISANSYGYIAGGQKYNNATGTTYGASYTTNDIIGIALDMDAGTLTYYKNNTSQGTAFSGLSGIYLPSIGVNDTNTAVSVNFGQRPFTYTPPTGYKALNTFNLPDSTIKKGNTVMDATLYTGTRATQVVTNAGAFKPDLVWCKSRSFIAETLVSDSVRGTTKQIFTSRTDVEQTDSTMITSFNSNGFTLGDNSGGPIGNINYNIGATYVAWQWQAGQGSTSSNTSGSITSTTSVNTTAGFSVVTYTGNGAIGATVGHGLGVAPSMIILKRRTGATASWLVWHRSLSNLNNNYLLLDTTNAQLSSTNIWGTQTSSVIALDTDSLVNEQNANGSTFVAYCWAEIAGFSKFTSYTGNGSTDGPFIFLGFRPKFVMIKRTDGGTNNWVIFDSSRNTYNATGKELKANTSAAEYDGDSTNPNDFLSNGLKIRHDGTAMNIASGTYIVAAFAENPFKNSNAR